MKKVIYILGQLSDSDVDWLTGAGQRRNFAAGDVLLREGAVSDEIFFVIDGEVTVSAGRAVLATLGSGEILGEMSLVDSRPASASVTGKTAGRVMAIHKQKINDKLKVDTAFAARFFKALALFLSERMRGTVSQLGYGKSDDDLQVSDPDELEGEVLDNAYLAGLRFDRMMKQMKG